MTYQSPRFKAHPVQPEQPRDYDRLFAELNLRQMRQDRRRDYAPLVIVALAFSAAVMVAVGVAG